MNPDVSPAAIITFAAIVVFWIVLGIYEYSRRKDCDARRWAAIELHWGPRRRVETRRGHVIVNGEPAQASGTRATPGLRFSPDQLAEMSDPD